MPTTHYSEAALSQRREKYEFARSFPGLLASWAEAGGKVVHGCIASGPSGEITLVCFTDGTIIPALQRTLTQDELLGALLAAHDVLASFHPEAAAELAHRVRSEREAMRKARMEKVLGAVETNMPEIPELRDELLRLLERLD